MSDLTASSHLDRHGAADWLWFSAHTILGVMPVVMAIGDRASTLVVAVVSAVALSAMAAEGRVQQWLAEAAGTLRSPLGISVLAFFGFAALSIAWSIAPGRSLQIYAQFVLTLAGVFLLAFALPRRMPRAGPLLLATSVAVACVVIIADLSTDMAIRRALGLRSFSFIFNRPVLTLLVLMIPLLWLLLRRDHRWVSVALAALVAETILHSESGAAVLGLLAGLGAYILARVTARLAVCLVAIGLVAAIVLAPMAGAIAERVLPSSVHEAIASTNSRARVEIWKKFGEAVRRQPVLGAGFGTSPSFPDTPVAHDIAPDDPSAFALWHAHNAALQVWVELGAIGAVLGIIVLLLLLARIAALPPDLVPVSLALVAAAAAVSLVGHGAWQGWWAAAVGAAVVWLRYDAKKMCDERNERV
jgi:O-antigen ligase